MGAGRSAIANGEDALVKNDENVVVRWAALA